MKMCLYCKKELSEEIAMDVCRNCGVGVWGEKMFSAIMKNMEGMKE